jgi:hypothetical protein
MPPSFAPVSDCVGGVEEGDVTAATLAPPIFNLKRCFGGSSFGFARTNDGLCGIVVIAAAASIVSACEAAAAVVDAPKSPAGERGDR